METRKNKGYLIIIAFVAISCFLTYGVTQAYVEAKYDMKTDDYFGTYYFNQYENTFISISPAENTEPDTVGVFGLYDNHAHALETCKCEITKKGIITIYRKNGSRESMVFIKNKIFYITSGKDPVEIQKEDDSPI